MSETTATSKSLERKTKKELVEIILRKDSVEQSLRKDIADTEKQLKETRDNYSIVNSRINSENVHSVATFLKKEIELAKEAAKKASSTIEYLEGENRDLFKKFHDTKTELETLKSYYEKICDEFATINQEKKDMQKRHIVIGLLLVIGLVLAVVL